MAFPARSNPCASCAPGPPRWALTASRATSSGTSSSRSKGRFDWSFYDAVVAEAEKYGLRWFPLLIVGSAYTLPPWYHDSGENVGFACLEHGQANNIQSIYCENQTPYVRAFLEAFGKHYEPGGAAARRAPRPQRQFSANRSIPQAATGVTRAQTEHIHIGLVGGRRPRLGAFRRLAARKIRRRRGAQRGVGGDYAQWGEVRCFIPQFAETPRKRKDFVDWYMGAMSDWCERWAVWGARSHARDRHLPVGGRLGLRRERHRLYGPDGQHGQGAWRHSRHQRDRQLRAELPGNAHALVRRALLRRAPSAPSPPASTPPKASPRASTTCSSTTASTSFSITRTCTTTTASPPGSSSRRCSTSAQTRSLTWPCSTPTPSRNSDDGVFRNLYASSFYQRVGALRPHLDFDYCSERMVLDGALERYRVLVLVWSHIIEADALGRPLTNGCARAARSYACTGTARLSRPSRGNRDVDARWREGDTGSGPRRPDPRRPRAAAPLRGPRPRGTAHDGRSRPADPGDAARRKARRSLPQRPRNRHDRRAQLQRQPPPPSACPAGLHRPSRPTASR